MIEEVLVTNSSGETLPLTLKNPGNSGFYLLGVDGLGPVKTNLNIRDNTLTSGGVFNSARTPTRNIVIYLRFMASPTIEAARLRSYNFFMTESRIRLDIRTDAGTYYIYGYVESNETYLFSQSQGCSVSIICPNPFFQKENEVITGVISLIEQGFTFPFSNEGTSDLINLGERIYPYSEFYIPFYGTVNIGPKIIIQAQSGQVNNPTLYFHNPYNINDSESLGFTFTESLPLLEDGDYLEVVCERTNKSVRRYCVATSSFINYIGAVNYDSSWPILHPGDNVFAYDADSGVENIRLIYEYMPRYIGV